MKKLFFLAIGLTLLVHAPVSADPAQPKSFFQWCQQKSSVPAATRHTIDVLLKEAGTNNCQKADSELRSLDALVLRSKQISDLKPLAGLTNLTILGLQSNQISDLKPLARLTNLSDLKPLARLTNLTVLDLKSNQISDVSSLTGLTNLQVLFLDSNQISVIIHSPPAK
jgi:internalin A